LEVGDPVQDNEGSAPSREPVTISRPMVGPKISNNILEEQLHRHWFAGTARVSAHAVRLLKTR
jgi:hypothetical protein